MKKSTILTASICTLSLFLCFSSEALAKTVVNQKTTVQQNKTQKTLKDTKKMPEPSTGGTGAFEEPYHGGGTGAFEEPSNGGGGSFEEPSNGGGGSSFEEPSNGGSTGAFEG